MENDNNDADVTSDTMGLSEVTKIITSKNNNIEK
jgi:hypothetical protein